MGSDSGVSSLEDVFGPSGHLASTLEGFEHRPSQLRMAREVERAIQRRQHAVIEAPTGLGKSFAYLVPALLSGLKVIVATANKSLQDQLADKDVPGLLRLLHLKVPYAVAKGRSNYICHYKWHEYIEEFEQGPTAQRDTLPVIEEIRLGLDRPDFSGDVDYLQERLPQGVAREVVSFPNDCIGQACRFSQTECCVNRMRDKAFESQLIITNHHLLLFSLKPQHEDQLLPAADVVIVDEAHNLEDAATRVFQTTINSGQLRVLLESKPIRAALGPRSNELNEQNRELFASLRRVLAPNEPILESLDGCVDMGSQLTEAADWVDSQAGGKEALLQDVQEEEQALLHASAQALKSLGNDYLRMGEEDTEHVRYRQDMPRGGIDLHRAPLRPSEHLRTLLFGAQERAVITTSATLSTQNDFTHFRRQCGLEEGAMSETQLPHLFDYSDQALLFQPPMPRFDYRQVEQYYDDAAEVIRQLLEITNGDTLCLFSSWKGLNLAFDKLSSGSDRVVWPIRSQGEDVPRRELLEWLRTTPGGVLCATRSFWEGIDLPGAALVSVILDKLPFPSPADPVHKMRMGRIEEEAETGEGVNSFAGYMLPHMSLSLKQGFGRLIRRHDDRGVVTILDSRLHDSRYGKSVRARDLPPARYTRRLEDVFRFMRPDWRGRHVYGLNLLQPEPGHPLRVELTVPQQGRRDAFSLDGEEQDSVSVQSALENALRRLRTRIEDKGGNPDRSILEIRYPSTWREGMTETLDRPPAGLDKELSSWLQVTWQDLVASDGS